MSEKKMTLGDILKHVSFEDVHLVHKDEDIELATIVELNDNTLTNNGKEHWNDVMNAKINRIYVGGYGLQVECEDVEPERLSEFSYVLAGYCGVGLYDSWISKDEYNGQEEPKLEL